MHQLVRIHTGLFFIARGIKREELEALRCLRLWKLGLLLYLLACLRSWELEIRKN